jgi:DNA-directed RNA polymerase
MENDTTIRWYTPNNFLVQMDYPNMRKHEVKTSIGPVVRQHRIRVATDERDRRKNINAIAANYVHSLDGLGGLLGEIVCMAEDQGIEDILACHDNGSVHAQNVGLFGGCVRQSAYNIFNRDLLSDFAEQASHLLPSDVHLPDTPQRGTMDLTKVLDSMYYWN